MDKLPQGKMSDTTRQYEVSCVEYSQKMEKQHSRGEREYNQIDRLGAKRGECTFILMNN